MTRYEDVQENLQTHARTWLVTGAAGLIGSNLLEALRSLLESRYPYLHDLHPVYREFRAGDVRRSQADVGKASQLLGYRPVQPVSGGLARALDWYVAKLAPRRSVQNDLPQAEAALSGS